jgi:hypothetical protein
VTAESGRTHTPFLQKLSAENADALLRLGTAAYSASRRSRTSARCRSRLPPALDVVRRSARPHDAVLGWVDSLGRWADVSRHHDAQVTPGVVVYRLDDRLFFANASYVKGRVQEALRGAPTVTTASPSVSTAPASTAPFAQPCTPRHATKPRRPSGRSGAPTGRDHPAWVMRSDGGSRRV